MLKIHIHKIGHRCYRAVLTHDGVVMNWLAGWFRSAEAAINHYSSVQAVIPVERY
jgi:hypothetical protein